MNGGICTIQKEGYYTVTLRERRQHDNAVNNIYSNTYINHDSKWILLTKPLTVSAHQNCTFSEKHYFYKGDVLYVKTASVSGYGNIQGSVATGIITSLNIEYIGNNFTTGS